VGIVINFFKLFGFCVGTFVLVILVGIEFCVINITSFVQKCVVRCDTRSEEVKKKSYDRCVEKYRNKVKNNGRK
jgi:hypothetical protein